MILMSFILSGLSVWSLWLISKGDRAGWIIGMMSQLPWAVYASTTGQWGFVVLSVIYIFVNKKGYENGRDKQKQP